MLRLPLPDCPAWILWSHPDGMLCPCPSARAPHKSSGAGDTPPGSQALGQRRWTWEHPAVPLGEAESSHTFLARNPHRCVSLGQAPMCLLA